MAPLTTETLPLTLSEQLDAMLLGWLERDADRMRTPRPALRGTAVITIASPSVPERADSCAKWELPLERVRPAGETWTVVRIEGPAQVVRGLAEITGMYRR